MSLRTLKTAAALALGGALALGAANAVETAPSGLAERAADFESMISKNEARQIVDARLREVGFLSRSQSRRDWAEADAPTAIGDYWRVPFTVVESIGRKTGTVYVHAATGEISLTMGEDASDRTERS